MSNMRNTLLALAACLSLAFGADAYADAYQADVIVYGDASGGVTAAVQAGRMGKSIILVSHTAISAV